MMAIRVFGRPRLGWLVLAAALAFAAGAGPAQAVTLTVTGGGLTAVNGNFACSGSPCLANQTFALAAPAAATGTITVGATTATIALSVSSSAFTGSFGGIDEVDFTNVLYNAVVNVTISGTSITGGGQLGTVAGSYEQKLAGGTVVASQPFNESGTVSFLALNCSIPNGAGTCALQVGTGGLGQYDLDINGQGLNRFVNTFNLTVIPEPGSGALLALGVALLAAGSRRPR